MNTWVSGTESERSVSTPIGIVLMVGITVVLVLGVAGTFIALSDELQSKPPSPAIKASEGGQTVGPSAAELRILATDQSVPFDRMAIVVDHDGKRARISNLPLSSNNLTTDHVSGDTEILNMSEGGVAGPIVNGTGWNASGQVEIGVNKSNLDSSKSTYISILYLPKNDRKPSTYLMKEEHLTTALFFGSEGGGNDDDDGPSSYTPPPRPGPTVPITMTNVTNISEEESVVYERYGDRSGAIEEGYPTHDHWDRTPVAFHALDERASNGGTITDYSPNENHATAIGDPVGGAQPGGIAGTSSYRFDGNDDSILLNSEVTDQSNSSFSMTLWFKTGTTDHTLFAIVDDTGSVKIKVMTNSDGDIILVDSDGDVSNTGDDPTDTWTHVGVRQTSTTLEIFVNSGRQGVINDQVALEPDDHVSVGGVYDPTDNSVDDPFDGRIDEFRMYNSSLTNNLITASYDVRGDGYLKTEKHNLSEPIHKDDVVLQSVNASAYLSQPVKLWVYAEDDSGGRVNYGRLNLNRNDTLVDLSLDPTDIGVSDDPSVDYVTKIWMKVGVGDSDLTTTHSLHQVTIGNKSYGFPGE